ncbi:MAG: SHOCT domain-containing protein [Phycisphaerae bacterium]|jgi:hypothetical protein|nr:SHOCT domain-containing protein [Phycisphaerae bacterium]
MTQAGQIPAEMNNQTMRRSGLIWLGIILLAAFFMPKVQAGYSGRSFRNPGKVEYKAKFINIEILTSKADIPAMTRIGAAFPAIAGVIIIIVGAAVPKLACGIIVTGLGVFMYLTTLFDTDTQHALNLMPRGAKDIMLIYVLILFGVTGLLAGSLAKTQRPRSLFASIMGILGGAMLLGGLLIPLSSGKAESCLIMVPVNLIKMERGAPAATGAFIGLTILLWAIAAIISFCNVPGRRSSAAKSMGSSTYTCLVIGSITLVIAILIIVFSQVPEAQIGPVALGMLKMILWITGLFLILPLGLAALAISLQNEPVVPLVVPAPAVVPVVVPAVVASPGAHSNQARLAELQRLLEQGAITGQEYDEQRNKIISSV